MGTLREKLVAFLLFCCGIQIHIVAEADVYGLCDVGVIQARNGTLVLSKGSECKRVILAPSGWRIKLTVVDLRNLDATFHIHDGGSRIGTRESMLAINEQYGGIGPTLFYTSSNAILIHTDKFSSNPENRLNVTFEMFPQTADKCVCPPIVDGQAICSFPEESQTIFYPKTDDLERRCTTTCHDGYEVATTAFSSVSSIQYTCELDQRKVDSSWVVNISPELSGMFNPNLITCGKVTPVIQVLSWFTFEYNNISCAVLNIALIESGVMGFIIRNTTALYVGECYRNGTKNCTVHPILALCAAASNPNNSIITLEVRDNVKMSENVTIIKMQYQMLANYFRTSLSNQIERYVTDELVVNGTMAKGFKSSYLGWTICPEDQMLTGPDRFQRNFCISCPVHYYKHYISHFNKPCGQCLLAERREINESVCVNGSRVYPKPSYNNCHHTCSLGKYFNNNSAICEWCSYGSFQNSTTELNPVCQICPAGNTTSFVGARSEDDCMKICNKGQFVKYPSCIDCDIGYYMPYEGNRFHKCYKCGSGNTTLNTGTVNQTGCVDKCLQGEYFNISQGMCVLCPNNTFQDEVKDSNMRSCKICPSSTVTLTTGSTSLSECLGPCSLGEYLNVDCSCCEQCAMNTYNDLSNHTSFMCKECGKHKITQSKGATNISQCTYTCSQGRFFNITSKQCEECANNTYQDIFGQGFCKPCPGNTFTLKTGSKMCIKPCGFGQFLNKSAELCQDCQVGYFQNLTNYVQNMCSPCPMDYYTDMHGCQNCTSCPDQGITVVIAATMLSECIQRCQPGFHLNKTAKTCQKCLEGFYQEQMGHILQSCIKCATANLTTLATGASSAEQCVSYCASLPCMNGAQCSNIDNGFNCTCPAHLAGKKCDTIIDHENADRMEISVRFPDLIWNNNLSNPNSEEFKNLARQIEDLVREEFGNDSTIRAVKVINFKQGSVISDLEFIFVAGTDFGNPQDTLTTVIADGKIGNLTVDISSLEISNYTCTTPLGMENGRIPDKALSSANPDNKYPFANARLNHNGPGWTPQVTNIKDAYLQVDFQEVIQLTGIATQGSSYESGHWLQTYYFNYSVDGKVWQEYKEDTNKCKVFHGNSDENTVVRNNLKYPVRVQYVRLIKYVTSRFLSYRCEFYGCPIPSNGVLPTLVPPRTDVPTGKVTSGQLTPRTTHNGTLSTSDDDDDDDDTNVSLIVGLVLGLVALFILIGIAVWFFSKKKKSHSFGSINAMPMKEAY